MSVKIILKGVEGTDEYLAAQRLKTGFQVNIPATTNGRILIKSNAKLIGSKVKDIDIIIMGAFDKDYELPLQRQTGRMSY